MDETGGEKYLTTGKELLEYHPKFVLVGRDAELNRLQAILARRHASSVILTGQRGVGCEHLCRGMQASKNSPGAPYDIVSKQFFWLDVDALFSSGNPGEINDAFQAVMRRLRGATNSVLVVEDTRDFLAAARSAGCSHFVNALVSAVWARATQVILIAANDELGALLAEHNDFRELFTLMKLEEPVGDALRAIVQSAADRLSEFHGIRIAPGAVERAVEHTNKYRQFESSLAQPERSISLIDRSLAEYKLREHRACPSGFPSDEWEKLQGNLRSMYREMRDGEEQLDKDNADLDHLREQEKAQRADARPVGPGREAFENSGFETEAVRAQLDKIKRRQRDIEAARAQFKQLTAALNERLELTPDVVTEEFSRFSGIPADKLNQNDLEKLRGLKPAMLQRIYGQDNAVEQLCNAVRRARAGRPTTGAPQAAFLFYGPSGTGKTEIAKALAATLYDDEKALTRFDMSEYMEKHAVSVLIGAPPGYDGFEVGGVLTNLMLENGSRILLFDEIEKAHPDVFNIFLQVLSDGRLTDRMGRTVSFENAIILMTTNLGAAAFLDDSLTEEQATAAAMEMIGKEYKPEFLNRFAGRQNIIPFRHLTVPVMERIFTREIGKVNAAYRSRNLSVTIADEDRERLCTKMYKPETGARGLPGYIETQIEPKLVDRVIDHPGEGGELVVKFNENLELGFAA